MADREALYTALRNADVAGDVAGARKLAAYIQSMPSETKEAAPKAETSLLSDIKEGAGNLAAGVASGFADVGNTVLNAAGGLARRVLSADDLKDIPGAIQGGERRNAERNAGLKSLNDERKDSTAFNVGRIGGNVAATYPIGGALSAGVKAAVPSLAANPLAAKILESVASSGFRTGAPVANTLAGKAADLGIRAAGGAITGGASAGLVNPEDMSTGAIIGGGLPVVAAGVGKVATAAGNAYRTFKAPAEVKLANKLATYIGVPADDLQNALTQQGPQMIPGYQMTVPQIVQSPAVSQLQRTLKTAGTQAIGDAERAQQVQFRNALSRVAPIDISVQDAAQRAGDSIQKYAIPARQEASERVRQAFDMVDPLNETALNLPIDQMKAARAKYLGPGTFGTGTRAQQAIDTAERVGTETTEAVEPMSAKKIQDLVLAVRGAGGINTTSKSGRELSGEIRNLREAGLNNIVRPNTGLSVERMAERMHEAGFLPDNDPTTLLDLLHESAAGNKIYAQGSDDAYHAMMEATQGPPPGAETFIKPIPFQTVQNLRSSIGEAAEQAEAKGANKEAAALRQMVAEIDSRVNRAAGGSADANEFFPKDIADQYRIALKLHADKMQQFETGPQIGMFRKGADGQPTVQGAEIPGKFYSGRRSQVEDVASLKRLIGNRADLLDEMKRYAITEGASTSNQAGDLTSKFTDWLLARSGANRALFNDQELATLKEVGKAVERSINAENLGRVSGSDTAQKLASLNNLGLLDNKLVNALASKTPIVGKFSGPALNALRESASRTQRNALAQLMANPEQFASALQAGSVPPAQNALAAPIRKALPLAYKTAPVIFGQ